MEYDPLKAPDPREWLECEEFERIGAVLEFHDVYASGVENEQLHATFHVVVENQLALGDGAVRETLERLIGEGLDRHEAVHAIGSVLAGEMYNLFQGSSPGAEQTEAYHKGLADLTAKRWRDAG
jgi:hypothetical protein